MDVIIMMNGTPYIDGAAVYVPFIAIARIPGQDPFQVSFRIQYQWGRTLTQQRTAIRTAAEQAKVDYETAHAVTLPAINQIEILGV